ncbi:metallopeptidase [Arthrobacter echini]|uniref:Metallopeptidase n=1 Tax=Arthrobacter echini TaxID=1529066 RepID=A0A4S5E192_9MICC|nr:PepSY domain-containing protein [Arthrobacter echini]THJ65063.1 metallopeptidase [Arthrobacter echini]
MTSSRSPRPRYTLLPLATAALLALAGCTTADTDTAAGESAPAVEPSSAVSLSAEASESPETGMSASPEASALGTGSATPTPSPSATSSPTTSSTASDGIAAPGSGADDLVQAGRTALAALPGGALISIESEAGGTAWEVDVVTQDGSEQEMELSADGTQITTGPEVTDEDVEDRDKNLARLQAAELDYEDAVDKILTVIPEGRITELELDSKQGVTVWEADVLDPSDVKYSIQLDAATGTVVENQADSDD